MLSAFALATSAQVTDRTGVKDVNQVVDNTPDSIGFLKMNR